MPDIVHQLTIATDARAIRTAVTTEDGLAAFWTDQVRAEPTVGSKAWFGFGPNAEVQFTFEVAAIDDDHIAWKCIDGPDEWVGTTVTWQLTPGDGGTTVRFEHKGWRSADGELGQCSFVWAQILHRLEGYVIEGTREPYFRKAG